MAAEEPIHYTGRVGHSGESEVDVSIGHAVSAAAGIVTDSVFDTVVVLEEVEEEGCRMTEAAAADFAGSMGLAIESAVEEVQEAHRRFAAIDSQYLLAQAWDWDVRLRSLVAVAAEVVVLAAADSLADFGCISHPI